MTPPARNVPGPFLPHSCDSWNYATLDSWEFSNNCFWLHLFRCPRIASWDISLMIQETIYSRMSTLCDWCEFGFILRRTDHGEDGCGWWNLEREAAPRKLEHRGSSASLSLVKAEALFPEEEEGTANGPDGHPRGRVSFAQYLTAEINTGQDYVTSWSLVSLTCLPPREK